MTNSSISVRVVHAFADLTDGERQAWQRLYEAARDPQPFQSRLWSEAWWQVFGTSTARTRRELMLFVLSRDHETVGIFPMYRYSFCLLGVPLISFLAPVGSDRNLTELRMGLVDERCEREVYAALLEHLGVAAPRWDVMVMTAPAAAAVAPARYRLVPHSTAPVIEGFVVDLAADWESFQSGLKRNVKEAIRKCYNRFKRDGIEPEFVVLDEPSAIQEALEDFYRLHGARADVSDGTYHQNYFEPEAARALLSAVVEGDRDGSTVRLFGLRHQGRLIAARLGLATPGGLYLYYSGYEPAFGQYSIATRLVVEVLQWATHRGMPRVHLSFGRDVSKTRWSPREVTFGQYVGIQRTLRGRFVGFLYERTQRQRQQRIDARKKSKAPAVAPEAPAFDISVIIPTHRREHEVVEAISSVLGPSPLNVEVLVMDDTADGSARRAVEAIGDSRVRYFKRETPTGGRPALIRNELAAQARGEFLYFLDDDDRCLLDHLVTAHRRLKDSTAGVVVSLPRPFGDAAAVAHENEFFGRAAAMLRGNPSSWVLTARLLFKQSFLVCSSAMVRRRVFDAVGGFDPGTRMVEDVEFYMKAIRAAGHVLSLDPILERRVGHESLIIQGQRQDLIGSSYQHIHRQYRRRRGWLEFAALKAYARGVVRVGDAIRSRARAPLGALSVAASS